MAGQQHSEKIEKIEKVTSSEGTSAHDFIPEVEERVSPNRERFEGLLTPAKSIEPETTGIRKVESGKVSLVDEIANLNRRADQVGRSPPELLVAQAQEVMTKIDELKDKLNTPNLQIKGSVKNLLSNKLTHIDDSLKVALDKAGVEYTTPPSAATQSKNPIERFLGFLTDGQNRLSTLTDEVTKYQQNRTEFTPANMLVMQMKVGFIQQELEFFTALLNKALESTKTLMNVQV